MNGPCEEVLLNKLLNEMDGLREDAEILFVLTTNRPEQIESALAARPGRIDQAIEFPLPDDEGRRQLAQLYAGGLETQRQVVDRIVQKTHGASAALIKELMRRSAQFLLESGDARLRPEHVDAALEEMLPRRIAERKTTWWRRGFATSPIGLIRSSRSAGRLQSTRSRYKEQAVTVHSCGCQKMLRVDAKTGSQIG